MGDAMPWIDGIWTDENRSPVEEQGLTVEEVESVLADPAEVSVSRTTGRPIASGQTQAGRLIAVVFEQIDDLSVYPITAYGIEE
ncbi:MAG TPA: hypothetical protein PKB10_09070 [Tepidisphaeraceae bacterium]|nr:hypothetical protein [Tepidisphaeraceae bacterium]